MAFTYNLHVTQGVAQVSSTNDVYHEKNLLQNGGDIDQTLESRTLAMEEIKAALADVLVKFKQEPYRTNT